jgi:hypothetical protein
MASSRIMDVHLHIVRFLPNQINGNGTDRGQVQHRTGPQIEARAVPPAFDDTIGHVALGQPHRLVRAFITHREHLTTGAHKADGDPINDYTEGGILDKVGS